MSSGRPTAGGTDPVATDTDANSVLMELDKGLRSTSVGEQCEAIVRFPGLFEKYPFPILINSAFLKLADVFRVGSNFMQLSVLKVTQQSAHHLDKILNVDEFVRRIFIVSHSNDPVARALSLHLLGSIATIIPNKKNVHHFVYTSLESHDHVEFEAAIVAATCYAKQSKSFASGICAKISRMIEGLSTPVEMKLRLIKILRHMHHDCQSLELVNQLCANLLQGYPSAIFQQTILTLLTDLRISSLLGVPDQISLLMEYLQTDPRPGVRLNALHNLKMISAKAPHRWSKERLESLLKFLQVSSPSKTNTEGLATLLIFATIVRSVAFLSFTPEFVVLLYTQCLECCFSPSEDVILAAVHVLCNLTISLQNNTQYGLIKDLFPELAIVIQSLIFNVLPNLTNPGMLLKKFVFSFKELCLSCEETQILDLIDSSIAILPELKLNVRVTVAQTLSSVALGNPNLFAKFSDFFRKTLLETLSEDVSSAEREEGQHERQQQLILAYSIMLMISNDKVLLKHPDISEISELCSVLQSVSDRWTLYRVSRQAARLGYYSIADQIIPSLTDKVALECNYFWLIATGEICRAEWGIMNCLKSDPEARKFGFANSDRDKSLKSVQDVLSESVNHYHVAISSLKAASVPSHSLQFQCRYTQLRAEVLQAHSSLLSACNALSTCPPPAIAETITLTLGKHNYGRHTSQMEHCHQWFITLADKLGALHRASFDADPPTLGKIQIMQQCCMVLAYAIDAVILNVQTFASENAKLYSVDDMVLPINTFSADCRQLIKNISRIIENVSETVKQYKDSSTLQAQSNTVFNSSLLILSVPLGMPRFFFQCLQSTIIKVAVSPTPKSTTEPILMAADMQLPLKIEGVIQHGQKPGTFRSVKKVKLVISSECTQAKEQQVQKQHLSGSGVIFRVVEPLHDYFSAQCLLQFSVAGQHCVTMETRVIDGDGVEWYTGPRSSFNVRSVDDHFRKHGACSARPPMLATAPYCQTDSNRIS